MITKLPPQAPELEEVVLGALMLETTAYPEIEHILSADDFYEPAHQHIFETIVNLSAQNKGIDILTVSQELKRTGKLDACGGPYYISQLTSKIASTSHLVDHAYILQEKAYARRIIVAATLLADAAYDPTLDIYEQVEKFEKKLTAITIRQSQTRVLKMEDALREIIEHTQHSQQVRQEGGSVCIPTGFPTLDDTLSGGLYTSELTILAARPSVGKTQMALHFAKTAAGFGKKVLFISIEMMARQLVSRLILEDERISPRHLKSGDLTPEEWNAMDETIGKLWHLPISIAADHTISNLSTIKSVCRRIKRTEGLDMVILDYIGLVKSGSKFEKRYLEVGHITKDLKALAKEMDISVMALAQLKRPPQQILQGRDQAPTMEDLRESGNIEQDADNIWCLHKTAFNNPDAVDRDGKPYRYQGDLIVIKQRDGERAITIHYEHDKRYKKIWEK